MSEDIITYTVCSEDTISLEEAQKVQDRDYPVARYGFFGFTCIRDLSYYKATWHCFSRALIDRQKTLH